MNNSTMSEAAKAAQREYQKKWRTNNREKVAAINKRYWERKAAALSASEQVESNDDCKN